MFTSASSQMQIIYHCFITLIIINYNGWPALMGIMSFSVYLFTTVVYLYYFYC